MEEQATAQAHLSLIELATEIAKSHGGALLADGVRSGSIKLLWKCAKGHQWNAQLKKVKGGSWCPECHRTRVTIEDMRSLAKERGGACLSDEYRNAATKLRWRCSEFHEWNAKPGNIRRSWCPVCAHVVKVDIRLLRRIARERGGALLSTQYINSREPLEWRCAEGHTWQAAAGSVKPGSRSEGSWCPHCPRRFK